MTWTHGHTWAREREHGYGGGALGSLYRDVVPGRILSHFKGYFCGDLAWTDSWRRVKQEDKTTSILTWRPDACLISHGYSHGGIFPKKT